MQAYIRALKAEQGLTRGDLAKGAAYTVAFAVVAVAGPQPRRPRQEQPHAFTKAQMGHHDVEPT
jgi:hypothetical protein